MPQIARLLLCLFVFAGLNGCDKQQNPPPVPPSPKRLSSADIKISIIKDTSAADGTSLNELLFTGDSIAARYGLVTFSISPTGLFFNDSIDLTEPIDENGNAKAFILSRLPGTVTVRATIGGSGGASIDTTSIFTMAWPDQVVIQTDSTFLPQQVGVTTGITATLLRYPGKVNGGLSVAFSDSSAVDSTIASLQTPTAQCDTSGIARNLLTLLDTGYHGFIYITGKVTTPTGVVTGTAQIKLR